MNQDSNVKQMLLDKVETPEEKSPGVVLLVPDPSYIKEELEDVLIGREDKQPRVKDKTDTASFPVSTTSIKSEDADTPLFSQQKDEYNLTTRRSYHQMTGTTGEKDFGGAASSWNQNPNVRVEICNSSETEVGEDDEEHRKVNHPNVELSLSESDSDNELESRASGNTINKSFISSDCGKEFVNKPSLKRHMAHLPRTGCSSGLVSEKCFRVEKTVDSQKTVQTKHTYFTYDKCGKTFKKNNLNTHKRIHTGEKLFCCDLCGHMFSQKSHLDQHRRIHTGEKPFCCDLCGHSFSQKSHLNRHRRIHTGEKPFCCDLCGHSFSRNSSLNQHRRIHTAEKPFCCDLCGHSCSRKSDLNEHRRIHTGEKPFCCDLCGHSFSGKSHLNQHRRIHTGEKPFCCDLCGHSCSRKSDLDKHRRIHTGEKPFCCDLCGHSFSDNSSLNRHRRIHTAEKPF